MHRWFFADDHVICKIPTPPPSPPKTQRTPSPISLPDTYWKFCVKFDGKLCCNETLAVCGSCAILGKWDVQNCVLLTNTPDSQCWTSTILLPRTNDIRYRYLVCATNAHGRRIVRFWETHYKARLISRRQEQDIDADNCDIFGMLENKYKIERGWITPDIVVVQFKFFLAPFILNLHPTVPLLFVKITPLKLKAGEECERESNSNSSIKSEIIWKDVNEEFAFCDVASLQERNGGFHCQPKYGKSCGTDDILIFNLTLGDIENTAYLIDLYNFPLKAAADVPPYHFGYQHVLPHQIKGSYGTLTLNIMCATKHRPIGSMKLEYLVVRPLLSQQFTMKETFQCYWNTNRNCMDVGHRGCGNSFWLTNNILRENTVNSFEMAFEHGADMVEFDIQLTKDLVPVLYHDFHLYISRNADIDHLQYDVMRLPLEAAEIDYLKQFTKVQKSGFLTLPLNKLTLNQLKRVKVFEVPKDEAHPSSCSADSWKRYQPFETLKSILKKVDLKLGFLIEIKWPQTFYDGIVSECPTPDIDKNEYVDIVLDFILKNAGLRRIIFSTFDADICTMIRLKQNRYPVVFLINANDHETKYMDPRGGKISTSINFANAMELLGIICNSDNVVEFPGIVSDTHNRDLCIFCWGNDLRKEKFRNDLKTLGVDGIVFDRINHVLEPEDLQHNLFIINFMEPQEKSETFNSSK